VGGVREMLSMEGHKGLVDTYGNVLEYLGDGRTIGGSYRVRRDYIEGEPRRWPPATATTENGFRPVADVG